MVEELTDDELQLTIKSLGITYDATSTKIRRLKGHHRVEALSEAETCSAALTKFRNEQAARWRANAS